MDHRLLHDPAIRLIDWRDLREMTPTQVACGLLLTPPWLVLSLVLAQNGWLIPALGASFILFMAGLRQAHDSFHRTLGLPRLATDYFLFGLSLVMAIPLHAVKHNHLKHHAHPLAPDDVEGDCARVSGWVAILIGPIFTIRLLIHAWRHARRDLRAWIAAEAVALVALGTVAVCVDCYWLRYHLVVMLLGNCLTAFFAVWLVHHDCEPDGVFARTQRGWLLNFLTLNLFYHLEHHLFPSVPACRLPELARRLDDALPAARELPVVPLTGAPGPRSVA
jgi:fatty acid desaturase